MWPTLRRNEQVRRPSPADCGVRTAQTLGEAVHREDADREGAPASPAVATAVRMNSKERHKSPLDPPGGGWPYWLCNVGQESHQHRACGNILVATRNQNKDSSCWPHYHVHLTDCH